MNELQPKIEALKKRISPPYVQWLDVDEGWYQLVLDCDKELFEINSKYEIFQIKEKFGALRYYMSPSNDTTPEQRDAMWAITSKYEELSKTVCEATGQPGVLMKSIGGWRKTLNPEYAADSLGYAKYTIIKQQNII